MPSVEIEDRPGGLIAATFTAMASPCEVLLEGADRPQALSFGTLVAQEAWRIGLVNRVVPNDQLMQKACELARKLSMIPPPAMHLNKQNLNRGYDIRGFQSTIAYGAEMFALILMSNSEEKRDFDKIVTEQGLKAAFKWRDAKFA